MTIKRNVQLPRSRVKGAKPRVDELDYGNLAVNFFAGDEFLSTKNSDQKVVVFPSKNYIEKHPFSSLTIDNLAVNSGASISGNSTIGGSLRVSGDTYLGGATYVKSGNTLVAIENFITETANADANNYVTDGTAKNNTITLKRKGLADAVITDVVTKDKVAEEVNSASNWKAGTGNSAVLLKNSSGSAVGEFSVSEGKNNTASGTCSHAEGSETSANGDSSHAEGQYTNASGDYSHAEGKFTNASGSYSHAEGSETSANGNYSHAEGESTNTVGYSSHAEGKYTNANGYCSHAEGSYTTASGDYSHAEGNSTNAVGECSHAEGSGTSATSYSHSEGDSTIASGACSHAEGSYTTASGDYSHAEGTDTTASGGFSHAEGLGTITTNIAEHASGKYNQSNQNQIYSIGAGTDNEHRRNAIMVMQNGDTSISGGTLNVSGDTHFHGPYNYLSGTTIIENLSATSETFDTALSETSVNAVQNSAITKVITDNEKVTAASLNDLNDRKLDINYSGFTGTTLSGVTSIIQAIQKIANKLDGNK